jgi:phosphatidylglycerol:prolipoprotein diacylglycerol transferase
MRQVLIYIPIHADSPIGPPGYVLMLLAWGVFAAISLYRTWQSTGGFSSEFKSTLVFCALFAGGLFVLGEVLQVERLPVFGYGAALVAGVVGSMWVGGRRAKLVGVDPQFARDLTVWLVLSGVVGARLFHVIQHHERIFKGCVTLLDHLKAVIMLPDGGLTLYGGLILASLTYLWICHKNKVPAVRFADAAVPAVFVGITFGRLGCFLNGCCYGARSDLPWAVSFPQGSAAWSALVGRGFLPENAVQTMSLHPTQIYSSINGLVLAALTAAYYRYRKGDGSVVALALIMYPLSRFGLEIIRWDETGQLGTELTISQFVSLGVVGLGLVLARWSWTHSAPQLPSDAAAVVR